MSKVTFFGFVFSFLFVAGLFAQSQTFNSSGTFIVPAGITQIHVRCWGAGGGGGSTPGSAAGGGGGGAFSSSLITVSPGDSYAVVVGTGGGPGVNGVDTNFGSGFVIAKGGSAASTSTGGQGGQAAAGVGTFKYNGGNGANNDNNAGGGGGGSAFSFLDGGNAILSVAGIGHGNGGTGGLTSGSDGGPGLPPGGGGGGKASSNGTSGTGGNGLVYISWGAALPVTWLTFRGALTEDGDANLFWSTASEANNEGFDIQRSLNGRQWETIAFVPGAGTTSEVQQYTYTDPSLSTLHAPLIYYRLMQKDYDGSTDYSPVRVLELNGERGGIRVFPNPASEMVTIAFAEPTPSRGSVKLLTQNNRLILEQAIAPQTTEYQLRVAPLPSGTYILQVKVGNQEWTKRLVVE